MTRLLKRLSNIIPTMPRRRYCVYSGTNDWQEWRDQLHEFLFGAESPGAVSEYESAFACSIGARHAVAFGAGRMALYALLEAWGIGDGDEIVIPAFTCVVVPNALIYRGVQPIYVDIDPVTFNIDPNLVEAAITPRTKALYAQHTFGVPCDIDALREIGRRHGIPVIEDAAHALGATHRGVSVGALTEAAIFSTDHSKMIGTMMGGMVTTSDDQLADKLRKIQARTKGLPSVLSRRLAWTFLMEHVLFAPNALWLGRTIQPLMARVGGLFYFHDELLVERPVDYPYPSLLPPSLAKIGSSQLNKLPENLAHRREIAGWLEERIGWYRDVPELGLSNPSWLRYSFMVKDRAEFIDRFNKRFDLGIWFTSVVSGRNNEFEKVGYEPGSCKRAESAAKHIVNFPTHARLPLEVLENEWDKNGSWVMENMLLIRRGS